MSGITFSSRSFLSDSLGMACTCLATSRASSSLIPSCFASLTTDSVISIVLELGIFSIAVVVTSVFLVSTVWN